MSESKFTSFNTSSNDINIAEKIEATDQLDATVSDDVIIVQIASIVMTIAAI